MKTYKFKLCRKLINAVLWMGILVGSSCAFQALADQISNIAGDRFDRWPRASDAELDELRGGFLLPNGMNIDISLARSTALNGAVVSSSFYQLPNNISLLQNGSMNQALGVVPSGLGSIVQNSLDNQVIRTVTEANIAISQIHTINLNNSGAFFNNYIAPNAH